MRLPSLLPAIQLNAKGQPGRQLEGAKAEAPLSQLNLLDPGLGQMPPAPVLAEPVVLAGNVQLPDALSLKRIESQCGALALPSIGPFVEEPVSQEQWYRIPCI